MSCMYSHERGGKRLVLLGGGWKAPYECVLAIHQTELNSIILFFLISCRRVTSMSSTSLNLYLNCALASGVWLERETLLFPSLWFLAEPFRVTVQWQQTKNSAGWNSFNSMSMLSIFCRPPLRSLKIWSVMEKWSHHRPWKKVCLSSIVRFLSWCQEVASKYSTDIQNLALVYLQNLNLEFRWFSEFHWSVFVWVWCSVGLRT